MGQKCNVQYSGETYIVSKAVAGEEDFLECQNSTFKATDIGIVSSLFIYIHSNFSLCYILYFSLIQGFADSTGRYNISLSILWTDVPYANT